MHQCENCAALQKISSKRYAGSDDSLMLGSVCDIRSCDTSRVRVKEVSVSQSRSLSVAGPVDMTKNMFYIAQADDETDVSSCKMEDCHQLVGVTEDR